jgi:hypothetical protein
MQRGHGAGRHVLEHREMQHVGVEVDDVELVAPLVQIGQHRQVRGDIRLQRRRVEPDRLIARRRQMRPGARFGAGEQRHVVAQVDQSFAEVGDHALGAAVEPRRHGFVQRRNLGDLHIGGPSVQTACRMPRAPPLTESAPGCFVPR